MMHIPSSDSSDVSRRLAEESKECFVVVSRRHSEIASLTRASLCSTSMYYDYRRNAVPTSVRLDPETETLLKRLAQQSRRSKSEVIRDALHRMAESPETVEHNGPYDLVADLVGVVDTPSPAARHHKRTYARSLAKKRGH